MTAAPDRSASADMSRRSAEIEMAGLDAPPLSVLQAGIAWRRPEEIENSIPARFERIAALQPNAPAVIDKTTPLTYAMLNQAANRLAHELLAEGATPVVATGYLFGHGASQIVAMLGILKTAG
jgi:non-ribosomal peptide synthetase component F